MAQALPLPGDGLSSAQLPVIMGILNVTPDSFSDGGAFLARDEAVSHGLALLDQGAAVIDVGGESTRPGARSVDPEEELDRVVPVIEALRLRTTAPISIDTTKSLVARRAIEAGATLVNDISACTFDPAMAEVVAEAGVPLVLMHTSGRPAEMQSKTSYGDVVDDIVAWLEERIRAVVDHGVKEDQIVVDPGIGFGKTVGQNVEIMRRLGEFLVLGRPVLVGPSRKSFIGAVLDRPVTERLMGTAAVTALAVANGASCIRVHDVLAMSDVVSMARAVVYGSL